MIDEKKLIEDLLHNDGIKFELKLHDFTLEGVGSFLQKFIDHMKQGFINLINAQPKQEGWIPVQDRLPDDDIPSKPYLCYWNGHTHICRYWRMRKCFEFNGRTMKVTHWMALPKPPKDGET